MGVRYIVAMWLLRGASIALHKHVSTAKQVPQLVATAQRTKLGSADYKDRGGGLGEYITDLLQISKPELRIDTI